MTAATEHSGVTVDRIYNTVGLGWTGRATCNDCPCRWSAQVPGSPSDDSMADYWQRHREAPYVGAILRALEGKTP